MIVRDRPSSLGLLFAWRGSILPRIALSLLMVFLFSAAVEGIHQAGLYDFSKYSVAPFTLLGVALSIFLGFRNNASYDRWWEGRKQFGQMVCDIRSLGRSSYVLLGDHPQRRLMLQWVAGHYHALRGQLRKQGIPPEAIEALKDIPGFDEAELRRQRNVPDYCLRQVGEQMRLLLKSGELDNVGVRILDEHVSRLTNVQAACERLVSAPLPFAYSLLTHRTVHIYCYLLPFGLAGTMNWFTPIFGLVVAYTFFGLEALAQELEEPFGLQPNHLPLSAICRVNDISIAESLGDVAPEPMRPDGHILQ